MNDWQLKVDWHALGAAERELLVGELWCHPIYGLEERDEVVVAGFATEAGARSASAAVDRFSTTISPSRVSWTIVEVRDDGYLDEWRHFAHPWRVERLFVRPSWVDAAVPHGTIEIVIDPQRSFGSGAHASTRLILSLMQQLDLRERAVLDVGSGSGVLSAAAAVLGAARVEAIDIESDAVAATMANARRNDVGSVVHARVATVDSVEGPFDVVLANVLPSVHRQIAGDVCRRAQRFAIVAGMLDGQASEVESAYGATCIDSRADDGWTALLLRIDRADLRS